MPTPVAGSARGRAYAALALGVGIVSFASILIRYAHAAGVPSIVIAMWRLAIAALVLLPWIALRDRRTLATIAPRDRWWAAFAGLFLAVHFAAWILSLEYTSVASSTVLVTTNPIWIALASLSFFGERLAPRLMLAIVLAFAGSAIIFFADHESGIEAARSPALGNTLALVGSMAMCGYLLIGRGVRSRVALLPYLGVVYAVAAVLLAAAAIASGAALVGYSGIAFAWLLALALGPQLLGHGAFNYALAHLSPAVIAIGILGEPIGSTLLAWLLLGESVAPLKVVGMTVLGVAIWLAVRAR